MGSGSDGKSVEEAEMVKMNGKSGRLSEGSQTTLAETESETKSETTISPVRRVLHLIGMFESKPSTAKNIPSSPCTQSPSKGADIPPRPLPAGDQGPSQKWKYPTKPLQPSVARRPPIHPLPLGSVSPASSVGGFRSEVFQSNDEITTPPPAYDGSFEPYSPDVRKSSVVVSVDANPRRQSSLLSGFLASPGSVSSPKLERIHVPVAAAKAAKPERRLSYRHSRPLNGLSTMSSRALSPTSILSRRMPEEPGSSDGETASSCSDVSMPSACRSDHGAEGDVEEGGLAAAAVVDGDGAEIAIAASASRNAASARVADAAASESCVILPCDPSDEEKVRRAKKKSDCSRVAHVL